MAVVVAHPDDEVVGAGARLDRLCDATFIYVTDGAPQDGADASRHGLTVDAYRALRRRERAAALALCGIAESQIVDLDCPDQQATFRIAELALRLATVLQELRCEEVLTQSYEGGHPDHDATACIVHAAAALLRQRGMQPPAIAEMTSYHNGAHGLTACEFLPQADADASLVTVRLTAAEQERKRVLLACHASQESTLGLFPLDVERYRAAPRYDFRRPPHAGALFYELHRWGMTGARFRDLAGAALGSLGLDGSV